MNKEDIIKKLKSYIKEKAQNLRMDAGYAGRWDDGGASELENELEAFLDGYNFAKTGKTTFYKNFIKEQEKKLDPEYQKFLELKEKFKE